MKEIGDKAAQGRACGNLGNVHYLLGNFSLAIHYHNERLKIAKEFGDKAAERRAHSNLGNAHIFLVQWKFEYSGGSNNERVRYSNGPKLFGSGPSHLKTELN